MNTITNSNNPYSGSLIEGWNLEGTYDRIQFFSNKIITDIEELKQLIHIGLKYLYNSNDKTRLDIRCILDKRLIALLKSIENYGNIDISIKDYGDENIHLIIGKNKEKRKLESEKVNDIKAFVKDKISKTLEYIEQNGGFENLVLSFLEKIKGYSFHKNDFSAKELFELWGENFGWTLEELEELINILDNTNNCIYGLRNKENKLISAILISEGETTEWATHKDYQGQGLIEPLLVFANSDQINIIGKENIKIYVQARYNRSITPAIKSGMSFKLVNGFSGLLTNHVEVEGDMKTFVEGVLNPKLYSNKIISSYLSFK